jgi:hypothetical protein
MKKIITLGRTLNHGINDFRKHIIYKRDYARNLPVQKRHSDVYLVSFPSSGATWLSTILANINIIKSGLNCSATFYNYNQYIPDIHNSRDVYDLPTSFPGFRIIKSHSTYNPYYKFVIYTVRNPYSTMKSYYNFTQYYGNYKGSLIEFIKDNNNGINAWINHVESWLSQPVLDLHLVTYEGLKVNPNVELSKLFQNIGMDVDSETLSKAIELSSLSKMKHSENEYANNNPGYKYQFVKEGKEKTEIEQEAKSIIYDSTSDICREILHIKYDRDFNLI